MKTVVMNDIPISVVYDILFKAITLISQYSGGGTHTSIVKMVPNEEIIIKRKQHTMWLTTPTDVNFTAFVRLKKERNSTIITWDTQYHPKALDYLGMGFFMIIGAVIGAIATGMIDPNLILLGIPVGVFIAYGFTSIIDNSVQNGVYNETYAQLIQNPLNQIKHTAYKQKEALVQGTFKFDQIQQLVDNTKVLYKEGDEKFFRNLTSAVEQAVILKHKQLFGVSPDTMNRGMINLIEKGIIREKDYNCEWFWKVRNSFTHQALDLDEDDRNKVYKIGMNIVEGCLNS